MGKFKGTYYRTLDERGRLQIPSKLVDALPKFFVSISGFDGCYSVYEKEGYEEFTKELFSARSILDPTVRRLKRKIESTYDELEIDPHGRLTLTKDIRTRHHIEKDVVIIGLGDHFEIWGLETWEKYNSEDERTLEELAEEVSKHE